MAFWTSLYRPSSFSLSLFLLLMPRVASLAHESVNSLAGVCPTEESASAIVTPIALYLTTSSTMATLGGAKPRSMLLLSESLICSLRCKTSGFSSAEATFELTAAIPVAAGSIRICASRARQMRDSASIVLVISVAVDTNAMAIV